MTILLGSKRVFDAPTLFTTGLGSTQGVMKGLWHETVDVAQDEGMTHGAYSASFPRRFARPLHV